LGCRFPKSKKLNLLRCFALKHKVLYCVIHIYSLCCGRQLCKFCSLARQHISISLSNYSTKLLHTYCWTTCLLIEENLYTNTGVTNSVFFLDSLKVFSISLVNSITIPSGREFTVFFISEQNCSCSIYLVLA